MKEILHILLILFFSLTIISCAKKADSSSSSSGSSTSTDGTTIPIELSDVNANLSGKSLFVTNESIESNSSRTMNRSSEKSSTSTNSLLVIDNNSVADYGVLSNYELAIDQIRIAPDNKFAYIILEHDSDVFKADDGSTKDSTLISLNCGIIKVNLSNNAINCVENGIVPIKRDEEWWYGENYALSSIQFSSPSIFYLISYGSEGSPYKSSTELNCDKYCLYRVKNDKVTKLTSEKRETQAFYAFKSGSVAYYELLSDSLPRVESGIIYRDIDGNSYDITTKGGFFSGGDYDSIIKADDNATSKVAISRVINNQTKSILISMGGSDVNNLTEKIVKIILSISENIHINIIRGSINNYEYNKIRELLKNSDKSFKIYESPGNMAEIMGKSDLGIFVSLCQTIVFLKPYFSNATAISLSQLDPGNIITDEFI